MRSKRKLHAAPFPARKARFLKVELALNTTACFIGDAALAQQPMNMRPLDRNQLRPDVRPNGGGLWLICHVARQPTDAVSMTRPHPRQDLRRDLALVRELIEPG